MWGDKYWMQQTSYGTTMCCVWHCAIIVSSKASSQDGHCPFTVTDQPQHVAGGWCLMSSSVCHCPPSQIDRLVTLKAVHTRGASLINSVAELEAAQQGIKTELAALRDAVQQVRSET